MNSKSLQTISLEEKLQAIEPFVTEIQKAITIEEKLSVTDSQPIVREFLKRSATLYEFVKKVDFGQELMIKIILAIGQGAVFFNQIDHIENNFENLKIMLQQLLEVEKFYSFMGGLAGYYFLVIKLLVENQPSPEEPSEEHYIRFPGFDISKDSPETKSFIRSGIEGLQQLATIFPLGGAGDRLDLRDETTGEALPAAYLPFGGFSLLEGLIRDVQAQEFLYWKTYGKQLVMPIAMMTSHEKNNDANIEALCVKKNYWGRPHKSFRRMIQPLVPVITQEGNFSQSAPLKLMLKPGGHGVVWKLALQESLFSWFESLKRKKLLIRQINNPVAGTNGGLLAFIGVGHKKNKAFGFASCDRLINASEGMVVLCETPVDDGYSYKVINIEYTDFKNKGIQDQPKEPDSPYSTYPANTNILFADLQYIASVAQKVAVPGMMINMKNKVPYIDENGVLSEVYGGRLESMMQSLSNEITDEFPFKLKEDEMQGLDCFVTYGERRKTISVTKNKYSPEKKSIAETPEGCFYDQLLNCWELFSKECKMQIPELNSEGDYLQKGPSFIIRYLPALGPLYQVIAQKIIGGQMKEGSELNLEIAEFHCEGLILDGSLQVIAKSPLGTQDDRGLVQFNERGSSKCEFKNVTIINRGINREANNIYWKNQVTRHEQFELILHGNAEFFASNVNLEGDTRIEVPSGYRLELTLRNNKIEYNTRKITSSPTWKWHYSIDKNDDIKLTKIAIST